LVDRHDRNQFERAFLQTGLICDRRPSQLMLIHGHFPFWVCQMIGPCRPVTILRHPAALLFSSYQYARKVLALMPANRDQPFVREALELEFPDFLEYRLPNACCRAL